MRDRNIVANVIEGAVAGAVATWAMGKVTDFIYENQSTPARNAEDRVRGNQSAYEVAARKGARLAGKSLTKKQRGRWGSAIHWALGIGAGAVYGALRDELPEIGPGRGLLFGAAFWLLIDEGANVALGLTPGPTRFPWQAHVRGLIGHATFGTVADAALAVMPRV